MNDFLKIETRIKRIERIYTDFLFVHSWQQKKSVSYPYKSVFLLKKI